MRIYHLNGFGFGFLGLQSLEIGVFSLALVKLTHVLDWAFYTTFVSGGLSTVPVLLQGLPSPKAVLLF